MKTHTTFWGFPQRKSLVFATLLTVLASLSMLAAPAATSAMKSGPRKDVTGSGEKYKTEITRSTHGAISETDLQQASLLTSQVIGHVNRAVADLADNNPNDAKKVLAKAKTLVGIVRDILPTTDVTTVVRDAKGKEVYRYSETEQKDVIELFGEVAVVDVLNDVLEAKKTDTAGQEYVGSVQVYTSVMADLGYIERKIDAAMAAMDDPIEAKNQLILAQVKGIDMSVSEVESPLMEARRALKIAEIQVKEKAFDLAKDNLTRAKLKLDEYRLLFGKTKDKAIKEITSKIDTLQQDLNKEGVSSAIRECWQKTVKLFQHDTPNTAKATGTQKHQNR